MDKNGNNEAERRCQQLKTGLMITGVSIVIVIFILVTMVMGDNLFGGLFDGLFGSSKGSGYLSGGTTTISSSFSDLPSTVSEYYYSTFSSTSY